MSEKTMLTHIAKDNKTKTDLIEDYDNDDNDNDNDEEKDEFNLDDFNFDPDDDFDLNFDDEELADEEELKAINEKKSQKKDNVNDEDSNKNEEEIDILEQEHPFDTVPSIDNNEKEITIDLDRQDQDFTSDIIKMEEPIENINLFIKHMEKKGYELESSRFLIKNFAESTNTDIIYNINITINNEVITAITGYDQDNKVVTIPSSIIKVVQKDINDSIQEFI